ncbi:MAG: DUF5309 domain-containing protein [Pikeienuella sp.]
MAQPTNTFDTTDAVGIREDLINNIFNVDPDEVPFLSAMPKTTATATKHEWQTDQLDSPSDSNAHIEGDDTTAGAITPTVRLDNQCQILKKSYTITRTMERVDKAGRQKEHTYQAGLKAKAAKTDLEKSIFANNAKVVRNSSTAGEMAGAPAWLTTNTSAGGGGADPTGDGTDARTDGTQRAFTWDLLSGVLQSIWENSGVTPDAVYLGGHNKKVASGFTAARSIEQDADGKRLTTAIDVFDYDFGEVRAVPSRHVRTRDALVVNHGMWACAELDAFKEEELAKTGDARKFQIVGEYTIECRNEKASGIVADLTTS